MAEFFEDIKFELYISSEWVDVSADVLVSPSPRGSVGILNNGFLDRTPDGNTLTFSLDNSASNSQATLGYYSTLNPGNLVRLSFQYDGRRKYKFYGYILPDGVKVYAGTLGLRRVDVTARDWFGIAAEYKIKEVAYTTNKRANEAIPLLIAELPTELQPDSTTFGDTLLAGLIFVDLFDMMNSDTTILAEINKMAVSEMAYCYMRPRETIPPALYYDTIYYRSGVSANTNIYKPSSETTDLFLLANGTDNMLLADGTSQLLLTELQTISFGDADIWTGRELEANTGANFANYSKITLSPRIRDADATNVLWNMESYMELTAGQTVTGIIARYRDPNNRANKVNCIAGTPPVKNTDFKAYANSDGTGTDLSDYLAVSVEFYTAEAFITLTNTSGTTLYTGGEDILFQLRGQGVYVYDTVDYLIEEANAFDPYGGRRALDFNIPYTPASVLTIKTYAAQMLASAADRHVTINRYPLFANRDVKNMMAFMFLEPGHRATFAETVTGYNEESFINGYEFEIIAGKFVAWAPCLFRYDDVPVE